MQDRVILDPVNYVFLVMPDIRQRLDHLWYHEPWNTYLSCLRDYNAVWSAFGDAVKEWGVD